MGEIKYLYYVDKDGHFSTWEVLFLKSTVKKDDSKDYGQKINFKCLIFSPSGEARIVSEIDKRDIGFYTDKGAALCKSISILCKKSDLYKMMLKEVKIEQEKALNDEKK